MIDLGSAKVATQPAFVDAVAVALMRVAIDGPPDAGAEGDYLRRVVAADPRGEAARFAFALAADNDFTGTVNDGTATLEDVVDRVRAVWADMAGRFTAAVAPIVPGETGNRSGFGKS